MLTINLSTKTWGVLGAFLLFAGYACPQTGIHVPNRSSSSLFQGEQGKQKPETSFDPATQIVTVKMLVQDPNGYFIPNIRRDNFAVYENGVRQHNATVEIEHAPVSLTVLMEWGGRYQTRNKTLADEVPRAVRELFDELGRQDKIAILKYDDHVEQLADFKAGHETLDSIFLTAQKPEFSELNFYDAVISSLVRMKAVTGRKAIVLVSSGVDTFSKSKYEDVLHAARDCGTPIYVINLGPVLKQTEDRLSAVGPYTRVDWNRADRELQQIATASGGRMYSPRSTLDLSAVYDDIMENLRVRYVITYKSTTTGDLGTPRTVRVELIDAKSGGPLEIVDANGKPVRSTLFVEDSYVPSNASAAR